MYDSVIFATLVVEYASPILEDLPLSTIAAFQASLGNLLQTVPSKRSFRLELTETTDQSGSNIGNVRWMTEEKLSVFLFDVYQLLGARGYLVQLEIQRRAGDQPSSPEAIFQACPIPKQFSESQRRQQPVLTQASIAAMISFARLS